MFSTIFSLQRWVHKAKRLLEREGVVSTNSNQIKIAPEKLSSIEIDDSIIDTNNK